VGIIFEVYLFRGAACESPGYFVKLRVPASISPAPDHNDPCQKYQTARISIFFTFIFSSQQREYPCDLLVVPFFGGETFFSHICE